MHKHRWIKDSAELRCRDCGATRAIGPRLRCRLGMHAYMSTETAGTRYEECVYCRKVPLANRFYY